MLENFFLDLKSVAIHRDPNEFPALTSEIVWRRVRYQLVHYFFCLCSSSGAQTTTTAKATEATKAGSGGAEDIPDWKRSMMERQAARQREIAEADDALNR